MQSKQVPDQIIITTRLHAGSYTARAKGHKVTASSAESALRAAERLVEKLGRNADLLELASREGSTCIYSLPVVEAMEREDR